MKTLISLLALASLSVSPAWAQTTERSILSDQFQIDFTPMVPVTQPEIPGRLTSGLLDAPVAKLPSFIVRPLLQSRPLDPSEVYSVAGGESFEIMRHPGLALPILAKLNLRIADELFRAHKARKNTEDLNEIAFAMDRGGDAKEASYIRKSARDYSSQSRPWQFFGAAGNGGLLSGLIFGN